MKCSVTVLALMLILAGCSAQVSIEKAATAPLEIEKTVLCTDQPSPQKQGYCNNPLPSNKVKSLFHAAAVIRNLGCTDKQLLGKCFPVLRDSGGNVLFDTEVPLQTTIDSCLIPPDERKFLCRLELNPKQVEPGNYVIEFTFEDSIGGGTITAPVEFVVE